MNWQSRDSCPLCQSRNIALFRRSSLEGRPLAPEDFRITDSRYGERWQTYACHDCTFVFANPCPEERDLVAFYQRLDDGEYGAESVNRAKNFRTILRRLERFQIPDRSLLDVGAASGIFMDLARAQGYRAAGIEPSAALAAEGKSRYGLDIFQGTLEQYPQGPTFSVVTLLDLVEHVADPSRLLALAAQRLQPGGIVVVVTPDIGSIAARLAGGRWWHYRIAHIQFFNRRSLGHLLAANGLEIVMAKRYAWNFSCYYLLSRLFPRLKRASTLQKALKKINLKLQLFDSLEVYARKR